MRTKTATDGRKRTAEEAFGSKNLETTIGKVVNFHDDEDGEEDRIPALRAQGEESKSQNGIRAGEKLKNRAQALLKTRRSLPIYPHAAEIRSKLLSNDVLLLVGETGSGKSTQIPQFLLHQPCTRRVSGKHGIGQVGGCIAITQPRRVAAISLARRVAEEVGTPLGNWSPKSEVGYSVRFDTSTSPSTKIKFLTDGMLLQELLRDPWLKEYSVVVVDEVHERGANVDLVLGFLKRILEGRNKHDGRGGVSLKVVVMSATADMEQVEKFFTTSKPQTNAQTNGSSSKKTTSSNGADDAEGPKSEEDESKSSLKNGAPHEISIVSCFIKGRQFPVKIDYLPQPIPSLVDASLERIIQIHQHTPLPGDVLVFLPGQEMIDSLESLCETYANTLLEKSKQKGSQRLPKLLILPLFAALPTTAQQRVFEPTPPFTRKVILSTNIAETSVTVPGIRHVIDTGKRKARFFRPSLNLDTLLTIPISRSSAKQRAGRAGRESAGSCWRLYTEKTYDELEADTEPEIVRCDLSQLVLTLKAHNINDILSFPLLTQPPIKAWQRALIHLLQLGALERKSSNGQITELGREMSSLPLPANLARILLASIQPQFDCVDEIIDIVSGLSVENIWLPIHNRSVTSTDESITSTTTTNFTKHEDETGENHNAGDEDDDDETMSPIEKARRTLFRRSGDHMTMLAAIQAYVNENSDRKSWCRHHGISHRAMRAAMDVRKQLIKLMTSKRERQKRKLQQQQQHDTTDSSESNQDQKPDQLPAVNDTYQVTLEPRILQCLLTGFRTNIARQTSSSSVTTSTKQTQPGPAGPTGPYTTNVTNKPIHIHPSSVLFSRPRRPPLIMFSEFVYTKKPYARCVSEVMIDWLYHDDNGNGNDNDIDDEG